MDAGASELERHVDPAMVLLERSLPGAREWDDALAHLSRDAEAPTLATLAKSLDPSTARRVLTAHAIAATLRAADPRTTRAATSLLEALTPLLRSAGLEPHETHVLARAVVAAATSLTRLRGPLDGVRRRVWSACFGSSLYEAPWHWRDLRDQSVMILGATGTGKELVAQTIGHANLWFERTLGGESRAARPPTIAFNVAALPTSTAVGELFGWEKGAFTGADQARIGLVESAHAGTLFMDEFGDIPPEIVAMLLRALSSQEILPLGGAKARSVQTRWVTATSKDVDRLIADGKLSEDLRRRLSGLVIHMPALRSWDVHEVRDLARDLVAREAAHDSALPGRPVTTGLNDQRYLARLMARFEDELGPWLLAAPREWPGNVRQLLQLVRTWKMQGAAHARADLDAMPVLRGGPDTPAERSEAPAPVDDPACERLFRRVQDGTATLRELKAWYVVHSRPRYETAAAQAKALGVDAKTLKSQREEFDQLAAEPHSPDRSSR